MNTPGRACAGLGAKSSEFLSTFSLVAASNEAGRKRGFDPLLGGCITRYQGILLGDG